MSDERSAILHTLPDLQLGGGHLVTLAQVEHSSDRFRHVVCAVRDAGDLGGRFETAGAEVLTLGVTGALSLPGAIRRLESEIRARSVGVVHTNNTAIDRLVGQRAAKKAGVPVVNTCHWALPAKRRTRDLPRDWLARKLAKGVVVRAIGVSGVVGTAWAGWFMSIGLRDEDVVTIHPGSTCRRSTRANRAKLCGRNSGSASVGQCWSTSRGWTRAKGRST